ncbi:mitochondrial uncoupling protein 2 isoform X2 [Oryzias melastigma]|uniref:mitochondrial uncoupling protein 2 isoform X2 n=1 Tax=Oryzias melastigma TaxID=30732 RepID=UPI00168D4155|nr:mitochondrial uncoupling protein 2 isoform X2 [Oryzias melastigma]
MTDPNPPAAVRVLAAGSAGCVADLVTFPLDTAKVRLQIQGEGRTAVQGQTVKYRGVFGTIVTIVRTEGPRSLYNGLVAGLQRQMTFASVRIGLYDSMKQLYAGGSENAGLGTRLLAGCTTGAMAVAFAQPTDVVKVRFQAQIRLLESGTVKRYGSTTQAYRTIVRDEGLRGLWKGAHPEEQPDDRQHAMPLHRSLLGWLVHHGCGVSGGRREDPLHELGAGAVRWGSELCCNHADQRGTHSIL